MNMDYSGDRVFEIIREVIVEEGWVCSHTNDDGPSIVVNVNDVADKIECRLRGEGLL